MKRIAIAAALLALAACSSGTPEKGRDRAGETQAGLQTRADQLEAEAANGVARSETELNQEFADYGAAAEGNAAGNEARPE